MTLPRLRRVVAPTSVLAAMLSALAVAPSAQAVLDTTGPTMTVNARSSYVVGQQTGDTLPAGTETGDGLWFADRGAYRAYTWTAKDPSGICSYTVYEEHGIEGWGEDGTTTVTHATTGTFTFFADDYENSDDLSQIRIEAHDCAGNVTSVLRPGDYTNVARDYGPTIPAGWTCTACTCAIGDSMIRTSTRNSSLTTVLNGQGTNQHVALVMAKGPGRGRAAIYFDGAYVTTVDTYASTNTNRVVMWDKGLVGTANRTIKVVNLATTGRSRIGVDAYLG